MSLVSNYLLINSSHPELEFLASYNSILTYQKYYLEYNLDQEKVNLYIIDKIKNYIDGIYETINVPNADINYYIENINSKSKIKFKQVIKEIDIDHLISMMDYKDKNPASTKYKYFLNEYYKYFNLKIVNGIYALATNPQLHLHEQIDNHWFNINFENLINFTHTLNSMKYFSQNVENFQQIVETKFDSKDNIKKLIDYIYANFVEEQETDISDDFNEENTKDKKFNFRFVIDNLKANGFSLFEEYFTQLKLRYKQQINIEHIKKDKKLVYYFMQIVSSKDANSVNRYVNDMLIRIRDYIYDLEDSYSNNQAYQKIRVEKTSEKYAELDLTQIRRENYNFTIFKYCFADEIIGKFKPTSKLEPYLDIFSAYYRSRYPDRDYEIDVIKSTFITKMKFDKIYYVHMALIQYIVMDVIIKSGTEGIGIMDISSQTDIPVTSLQETINSLIKIKLIGRSSVDGSVENIKLVQNKNFTYEKNKISIGSMVIKEKVQNQTEKVKEFMFDKSMIVMCNIIDYVKKNNYFYEDTILDSIKYKIPFEVTTELLIKAIEETLQKEIIKKIEIPANPTGPTATNAANSNIKIVDQIMYKLYE